MNKKLLELLNNILSQASENFSGVGLIVWNEEQLLPIFPLRTDNGITQHESTAENLARISTLQSEFHDGFHILTLDLKLIKVAQYFSPPIIPEVSVNRNRNFGGRYLAALFGSALAGVEFTAIATSSLGVAIFKNGQEVYFEAA